jgi:hypothetical protein
MDEGEDIEELLICDEVDDEKQCSTCMRMCDSVNEKEMHEDASRRGVDRIKSVMDGPSLFNVTAAPPILCDDDGKELTAIPYEAPETLTLFTPSGAFRRIVLSAKLGEKGGLNGITHDILYQTICFMADWAFNSPKGFVDKTKYLRDVGPLRDKCPTCIADSMWTCERCSKGSELCRCKKPVDFQTNKARYSPPPLPVDWSCVQCDKVEGDCWCSVPLRAPVQPYHAQAYYSWMASRYSSIEQIRAIMIGKQKAWLGIYCSLNHYPDFRQGCLRWVIGVQNHMGIKDRWQWSPEQVSVCALLQAIDMVLMVLASDVVDVNVHALPYVAMICLMLQINADDDCRLEKVLTQIDAMMPYEYKRENYKRLYRQLLVNVFQFVLPGHTIFGDTSALWWMSPMRLFQDQEDKAARTLFQYQYYVPHISNNTLEELKPACPLTIRSPRTTIFRASAYKRLFEGYEARQKWIVQFSNSFS